MHIGQRTQCDNFFKCGLWPARGKKYLETLDSGK